MHTTREQHVPPKAKGVATAPRAPRFPLFSIYTLIGWLTSWLPGRRALNRVNAVLDANRDEVMRKARANTLKLGGRTPL